MSLSFRIVCAAIWTVVALIYFTNGAPTAVNPAHKDSNAELNGCVVFDFIVLPPYRADPDEADQESYNLTIPLEVCYLKDDDAVEPLCQEAHELLYNISSCSREVNMLDAVKEYIQAGKSPNINIEPQRDVCHGFVDNRNLFASNSFARRLTDLIVCPLVCQEAMKKACTFLLWGYQAQAAVRDIWEEIISKKIDTVEPLVAKIEKPTEPSASGGNLSKESSSTDEITGEEISGSAKNKNVATKDVDVSPTVKGKGSGSAKNKNVATKDVDVSPTVKGKGSGSTTDGSKPTGAGLQKTVSGDSNSISKLSQGTEELQSRDNVSKPLAVTIPTVKSASEPTGHELGTGSDDGKTSSFIQSSPQRDADTGKANAVNQTPVAKKAKSSPTSVQNESLAIESNQEESGKQNKGSTKKSEDISHESSEKSTKKNSKLTDAITPVENNGEVKVDPEMGEKNGIGENSPVPQETTGKVSSTIVTKHPDPPKLDDASSVNQEAKDGEKNSKASRIPTGDSSTNVDSPKNEKNSDEISGTNHDYDGNKPKDHDDASDGVSASDKGTEGDAGGEGSSVEPPADSTYPFGVDLNGEDGFIDDFDGSKIILNGESEMDGEKNVKEDDGDDDRSNGQSPGQQTSMVDKASGIVEETRVIFPEQEDTHFFFYFVTIIVFAIGGYVLFHNKQKIFALIIEGRHERRRRSGASYRKLETK